MNLTPPPFYKASKLYFLHFVGNSSENISANFQLSNYLEDKAFFYENLYANTYQTTRGN